MQTDSKLTLFFPYKEKYKCNKGYGNITPNFPIFNTKYANKFIAEYNHKRAQRQTLKNIYIYFFTWAIPDPIKPPPMTVTFLIAAAIAGEEDKYLLNTRNGNVIVVKSVKP